jgi:glucose-6-phosphate 1-dehydrogenase
MTTGVYGRVSSSYSIPTGRINGDPCTFILLGATGDLARRKLLGALVDLVRKRLVLDGPGGLAVLAVDRDPMTDDAYREMVRTSLARSDEVKNLDPELVERVLARTWYVGADLTSPAGYATIAARLAGLADLPPNRLFYLAVPPFVFTPIVENLAASGLAPRTVPGDRPWVRVIVEKPFGDSLETARKLNQLMLGHFGENQIFRIDHYLGKETVQNILVFRAANAIFEPVWNRSHIAQVQITCAETVGIESRGKYYESAGVIRDMFENHLLQLLALTAMELPVGMRANEVRDEKVKVLRSVRPLVDGEGRVSGAVRAQYEGYLDEKNVAGDSLTPTFAALRVFIDNGRWRGVPFYLRSGKRMAKRVSEIAVEMRVPPYLMRGLCGATPADPVEPNVIVLRVQPDDGVTVRFAAKIPGASMQLTPEIEVVSVDMTFDYADAFGTEVHPAYETLILDCMIGDATLFTRTDEVEVGWGITDPLLAAWERDRPARLPRYRTGSWGPKEADALLASDGFVWRRP